MLATYHFLWGWAWQPIPAPIILCTSYNVFRSSCRTEKKTRTGPDWTAKDRTISPVFWILKWKDRSFKLVVDWLQPVFGPTLFSIKIPLKWAQIQRNWVRIEWGIIKSRLRRNKRTINPLLMISHSILAQFPWFLAHFNYMREYVCML